MSSPAVHLVVQRYRNCRLLVHESEWVETVSAGVLVYISFGASATHQSVATAATTVLNLPVVTTGLWGDGSGTRSIRSMLGESFGVHGDAAEASTRLDHEENSAKVPPCSLVIVPQANLICKLKSQGKSIQYHGQIEKQKGADLYDLFCDNIRSEFYDLLKTSAEKDAAYTLWKQRRDLLLGQVLDIRLSVTEVFRKDTASYGSFDETGFPLTTNAGDELSKGMTKKLRKQYDSHMKRHQKWLDSMATVPTSIDWENLLPIGCVLTGTFGKRQGLELQSDMGPFCHVISIP